MLNCCQEQRGSAHSLASPRPAVVLGLACGARPMSENVQPRGFWKIGSSSIWERRVMREGVQGGGRQNRNVNKDCIKAELALSIFLAFFLFPYSAHFFVCFIFVPLFHFLILSCFLSASNTERKKCLIFRQFPLPSKTSLCPSPSCVNLLLHFIFLFLKKKTFACMETKPLYPFPLFFRAKKRNFGLVPFHTSAEIDTLKYIGSKQIAKRCLFTWGVGERFAFSATKPCCRLERSL